jgi:recombination protein RecR
VNSIDKLTEIFSRFPGIGPRQAKRFVYFLLHRQGVSEELIKAIEDLKHEVSQCDKCLRFFTKNGSPGTLCKICADPSRDGSLLMIVPRDVDLESVEKSGGYRGLYFVLGGSLPILADEPERRIRIRELKERLKAEGQHIKEIILAMNANSEGENTADFLREEIKRAAPHIKTSLLGRGLSTGAELEYADPETLKSALLNRS